MVLADRRTGEKEMDEGIIVVVSKVSGPMRGREAESAARAERERG